MTDVPGDNLCGSHLLRQSELYHVTWWYYTLVIDLIGQLRRDVIGRLSVKLWCHWLWRLVKLLLKWLLGSNLSQLYLAACENSTINTFKTLQVSFCWWEVSVSKGKGMEWVHFNSPPPPCLLSHRCHRSTFMLTNDFKWSEYMKKNIVSFLTPLIV